MFFGSCWKVWPCVCWSRDRNKQIATVQYDSTKTVYVFFADHWRPCDNVTAYGSNHNRKWLRNRTMAQLFASAIWRHVEDLLTLAASNDNDDRCSLCCFSESCLSLCTNDPILKEIKLLMCRFSLNHSQLDKKKAAELPLYNDWFCSGSFGDILSTLNMLVLWALPAK